ncbi:MAG TPA: TMEM175 family protein [Streptosporangiaceae bacterium]
MAMADDDMERSPERMVFFSDAVVAIALTLLILPLTEAVPEGVARHTPPLELIAENQWKIYAFLLSFAVIARLWIVHHQLFSQVKSGNNTLLLLNFGWLLTIVVLPFPTEVTGGYSHDRFTTGFYIGTVLATSLFASAMTIVVRRRGLAKEGAPLVRHRFGEIVPTGSLLLAFILVMAFPALSYYPMLLLLLTGPVERVLERRFTTGAAAR